MKWMPKLFAAGHLVISLIFVAGALMLIFLALWRFWTGITTGAQSIAQYVDETLESIAILTLAVATLELAQTLIEEEVLRDAQMSAPTRVRRFLSRFMVVLVVSLSIEALVSVFRYSHVKPQQLPYAAAIGLMAAALLVAWGLFIKFNRAAEELEPEAMEEAKREDHSVK